VFEHVYILDKLLLTELASESLLVNVGTIMIGEVELVIEYLVTLRLGTFINLSQSVRFFVLLEVYFDMEVLIWLAEVKYLFNAISRRTIAQFL
jgi:hypothetical protein